MAERPIIFSDPMVRAIFRQIDAPGTGKSQTRRVLADARVLATPERKAWTLRGADMERALQNAGRFRRIDGDVWFWESDAFEWQAPAVRTGWLAQIGFAPGDVLWVREAWRTSPEHDKKKPRDVPVGAPLLHMADTGLTFPNALWGKYRHGRFMPRWASRLTLTVTDVRVQRVQDISEDDARAEGVYGHRSNKLGRTLYSYDVAGTVGLGDRKSTIVTPAGWIKPEHAYQALWNRLHGRGSWDANPWVTATTFTAERRNIDGGR